MRKARLGVFVLVLVLGAALAGWFFVSSGSGTDEEAVYRQMLARFDVIDHDGTLSLAEWQHFGGAPSTFSRFDRDRDGHLDWRELRLAFQSIDPRSIEAP